MDKPKLDLQAEARLVRDILDGSKSAWHEFIERYSGIIYSVARRHMYSEDRVRDAYVDCLRALYTTKLAQYQEGIRLAPWIATIARRMCIDQLRHELGRSARPRGLKNLSEEDQEVFRSYYVEGQPFGSVLEQLQRDRPEFEAAHLASALRRIENSISDESLRRIAYDLHANSLGATSGRLVRYFESVRAELGRRQSAANPEYRLLEKEAAEVLVRLRAQLKSLPDEDQIVLTLRFERNMSAKEMEAELGLPSTRRAYSLIDAAIRRLRVLMTQPLGKEEEERGRAS